MDTFSVRNSRLTKCFKQSSIVFGIAACCLFATTNVHAAVEEQVLQIDFSFDTASVTNKEVSGYRLYMDGDVLCESQNVATPSISCSVAAEAGTCSFTLSALFDDGSESPQSAPFPFTFVDSDTDNDGIADSWEQTYFGNLTTVNAGTDYDHDGYTDLTEYRNSLTAEADPYGTSFNPTIVNVAGGAGYSGLLADSLVLNFPDYGLYTYNSASLLSNINKTQSSMTVTADIDSDGVDEIVSYFDEYGLYTRDNGVWSSRISSVKPENMIKFGNSIAIDFGSKYGLYTYSTAKGFTRINSVDPTFITEADVDSDGAMELAVYFPGSGLYIWDNIAWSSRLTTIEPEAMIKFGNNLAIDFGSQYGLYTFSTAKGFTRIAGSDPTLITEADVNSCGAMELAAYFPGSGLYIWDNMTWSSRLTATEPEAMIKFGNSLAIDFGSQYGLYTYSTAKAFTRINSSDPTLITEADVNSCGVLELVAYFPSFGVYIWDNGFWSNRITAVSPDLITSGNIVQ